MYIWYAAKLYLICCWFKWCHLWSENCAGSTLWKSSFEMRRSCSVVISRQAHMLPWLGQKIEVSLPDAWWICQVSTMRSLKIFERCQSLYGKTSHDAVAAGSMNSNPPMRTWRHLDNKKSGSILRRWNCQMSRATHQRSWIVHYILTFNSSI